MTLALVLHIFGLFLWVGGLATLQLLATKKMLGSSPEYPPVALKAIRFFVTPGLLLAWAAGLTMLLSNWSTLYAKAGWMHGKLTIALVLTAMTGIFTGKIRKAAKNAGVELSPAPVFVPFLTLLLTLIILVLVEFRFGA